MERKTCPNCGGAIEAERAGGLCPACLLKEGLQAEGTSGPRLKRSRLVASRPRSCDSTFTATSRSSDSSRAR